MAGKGDITIGSLDFATLREGYASGRLTPSAVAREVYARIRAAGDDHVWIHLVDEEDVLSRAQFLEATGINGLMPLFGLPFAVKDNIDVAGCPTTAACPAFASDGETSAPIIDKLINAGALLIGKTNLDQFATGLAGVRSPHGTPRNAIDPAYVPGGSSSGSAVAVSAGLVSFALGTDTGGSIRVPASFNNVVGLKPTRGLVSTRGVVPASRSLDCVAVLALTVTDAAGVLDVIAGFDQADPFSRPEPAEAKTLTEDPIGGFRFGVPQPELLRWFGDEESAALFKAACERLTALGGKRVEIDFAPFAAASELFSSSAVAAERTVAVGDFISQHPEDVLPVIRDVVLGAQRYSAVDAYRTSYKLEAVRRQAQAAWQRCDVVVLPTTGTIYTTAELAEEPLTRNANLGYYAYGTNLLDQSAVAVPSGFRASGLPAGITLVGPAFRDRYLARIAELFQKRGKLPMGATGHPLPLPARVGPDGEAGEGDATLPIVVVGLHLSGEALNYQLTDRGGKLLGAAKTAPVYRLFALPGKPQKPGLVHTGEEPGFAVEVEIWELPAAEFGRFVASVKAPLAIGSVMLDDGRTVSGFLCESYGVVGAADISGYGGWRAYRKHLATAS
jgi:allophanate hydrolase